MDFAHRLALRGFDITFVHTEYNHARVLRTTASRPQAAGGGSIHLATVPDGLGPNDSRQDVGRFNDSLLRVVPESLERLIQEEREAGRPVTCFVADGTMAWTLDVAGKFGIPGVVFWPASAEILATTISIPKLIQEGMIDSDEGKPVSNEPYHLIPGAPPMSMSTFPWTLVDDPAVKRSIFNHFSVLARSAMNAKFVLCNSFLELERPVFTYVPRLLPIGPYFSDSSAARLGRGSFWTEDRDCLRWLDMQPPESVVYISFGSVAVLGVRQFEELALGLELSGRPFIWVVRPGLVIDGGDGKGVLSYPPGFQETVAGRGRMVEWVPQREVLAHPAVACFLSHCGWNSVMEGMGNGVPFLCWPYFLDQISNSNRLCDVWRIGVRVVPDRNGLVPKEQIKEKLELVLGDEGIRVRALEFKKTAARNMEEGGTSFANFNRFVDDMKKQSEIIFHLQS